MKRIYGVFLSVVILILTPGLNENAKSAKCAKSDLPIICLVCEKVWFSINFWLFRLSKFQMTRQRSFREFLVISTTSQIFLIYTFLTMKRRHFYLFIWNLPGYVFCFIIFSKWKKHYHLPFDDKVKMYCCALC